MKLIFLLFCVIAYTFFPRALGQCEEYTGKAKEQCLHHKNKGRRRRLETFSDSGGSGPCASFNFAKIKNYQCPEHPTLNPKTRENKFFLSVFAHEWIDYTCCQIVTKPLNGIIASVWMWLQVCTQAMTSVQADSRLLPFDDQYALNNTSYEGAPLRDMKHYCPTDLDGGELTEWVVATFFPVMEKYNPHFTPISQKVDSCKTTQKSEGYLGAVTLLHTAPKSSGAFGHVALLLHDDNKLTPLPEDNDKKDYVSFSSLRNTVGVMITGTKADHIGFGFDLEGVTDTVTLYNADVPAMMTRWENIKGSGQMFDLLEWNCARTVMDVLNAGFPDCQVDLRGEKQLWTPKQAFQYAQAVQKVVNKDSPNDKIDAAVIRKRHIHPVYTTQEESMNWGLVGALIALSFLGNLVLVAVVLGAVIAKVRADAEKKLETGLAKLLIAAREKVSKAGGPAKKYAIQPNGAGQPSRLDLDGLDEPLQQLGSPRISDAITQIMDAQNPDAEPDGMTDFAEFESWARDHNLSDKQTKMLWKDLDKNKDSQVSKKEWDEFIQKRPKLKWLVTRLKSARRLDVPDC